MPLWRVYSAPNLLSEAEKASLSATITKSYTQYGIPSFYITILYVPLDPSDVHGGSTYPNPNFIRITVEQIAHKLPDGETDEGAARWDKVMSPLFDNLGLEFEVLNKQRTLLGETDLLWEISIQETPQDLWQIQGLRSPPARSERETTWRKEKRTVKL